MVYTTKRKTYLGLVADAYVLPKFFIKSWLKQQSGFVLKSAIFCVRFPHNTVVTFLDFTGFLGQPCRCLRDFVCASNQRNVLFALFFYKACESVYVSDFFGQYISGHCFRSRVWIVKNRIISNGVYVNYQFWQDWAFSRFKCINRFVNFLLHDSVNTSNRKHLTNV